jgi:hypothetical protein
MGESGASSMRWPPGASSGSDRKLKSANAHDRGNRVTWRLPRACRSRRGGVDQEPVEQLGGRPTRGREHRFKVVRVVAVEAEQGVQVHGAAGLELGDLGKAEWGLGASVLAGAAGQLAFDRVDGSAPELGTKAFQATRAGWS